MTEVIQFLQQTLNKFNMPRLIIYWIATSLRDSQWRIYVITRDSAMMTDNMSFRAFRRRISCKLEPSFRGRSLLRLALNGYTQIQIEKILFSIMNFRFSPSARLAEESHTSLVRDISLLFNMTEWWRLFWILSKSKIFRNDVFYAMIGFYVITRECNDRSNPVPSTNTK